MTKALSVLAAEGTLLYADNRQIALINGLLTTVAVSINIGTSTTIFTSTAAHGCVTGSRIRFSSSGVLPLPASGNPLNSTTDYYLTRVSATTFTISRTLGGAALIFSTNGTGTHTLTEQLLTAEDSIAVICNHEIITHLNYTVRAVHTAGTFTVDAAQKLALGALQNININVGVGNGVLSIRHILLIRNGSTVLGNTTGDRHELITYDINRNTAEGNTVTIPIQIKYGNG
jgi:hypothetical protein